MKSAGAQWVFGGSDAPINATLILNGNLQTFANDVGWWSYDAANGFSNNNLGTQSNYVAGIDGQTTFRDFFKFRIPGEVTFTSAVLRVKTYFVSGTPTLTLYDYLGTTPALIGAFNSADGSVFNDLGTGTVYGSRAYSNADDGTTVDITLNADAVAMLNKSGAADFSIGGRIGADQVGAIVTPEPSSLWLLATGGVCLMLIARRRREGCTR